MSGYQANTGLARMRSLRNPTKAPLTASPSTTSAPVPSTTSHVSIFITNLHLLDFDQEKDWPDITPGTFSSKDAAGGLKNRIQCVEWALYHLFVLWDGQEAKSKLRPFYPPLDQVQSINLRSALLRSLEQLKRSGLLGRDAVIRKTMLDECKGERFEEVLAVFSSAVLKKLVAERALNAGHEYRPTISEKIALENYGYSGERTELNALLLAHKASVGKILKDKNAARTKYKDFEDLVALKQRSLARRREQIKAAAGSETPLTVSDSVKTQARSMVKNNWTGSDQWAETLLSDDTGSKQGSLLTTDFEDVWTGIRAGRLSDIEDRSIDLLEQLDQRVRLQRSRLDRWQGLRQELFGPRPQQLTGNLKKAGNEVHGVDLGFKRHKDLQPDQPTDDLRPSGGPPEYAQLLLAMKSDLENMKKPQISSFFRTRGNQAGAQSSQFLQAPKLVADPVSDLSEWEDELEEEVKPVAKITTVPSTKGLGRTNSQLGRTRPSSRPTLRQRLTNDSNVTGSETEDIVPRRSNQAAALAEPMLEKSFKDVSSASHRLKGGFGSEHLSEQKVLLGPEQKILLPPVPDYTETGSMPEADRPVSPTQAAADEILASMSNASPSPLKRPRHTLNLAERAMLSMTRTKSFEPDDEFDSNMLSPSVARSIRKANQAAPVTGDSSTLEDDDLIARTRRSMAGFEAAKQKAQLERSRSQRKSKAVPRKDSHFPSVEEEEAGEVSVVDDLLEAGPEDMEAIFRSRPKMRTSPAPSPHRRWNEEEYET